MKNVIILGAGGNIARHVIDILAKREDIHLTLFLRNARRLKNDDLSNCTIVEGDVLDYPVLSKAIKGQEMVYVNLVGDLENMSKNIVRAMAEHHVKRIIAISSIGIYDSPLRPALIPYRKLADIIEASGLDFTILRPTWFSNSNEVDYELTRKGEPERGSVISQKSIAAFIAEVVVGPEKHVGENLGINRPGY
jgi:uncharacterized protein YbjT (DUF2867 family)